jgi:hypothetical protein
MIRESLARCWLAALLVLFTPVIDEAGAGCIYDSDTFNSSCAAELVDAREDSSGGQTIRRYEV